MGFTVKKGSEKGSEKVVSRRCLERPLESTPSLACAVYSPSSSNHGDH